MQKIAIHQPNFFPTYAYFQKIEQCDKFIIMRHCQFEKNNYQNRFKINNGINGGWATMTVNRGLEPISKKKYLHYEEDWKKIKLNLPQYAKELSLFDKIITDGKGDLETTNSAIIVEIVSLLGIKTIIDYDYPSILKSTDRLINILMYYKADSYLSGSSGRHYLDLQKFTNIGLPVEFQENQDYTPILEILKQRLTKN